METGVLVAVCLGSTACAERRRPCGRLSHGPRYSRAMDLLLATAKPWTYWIAPLLVLVSFLGLFSVILQYIFKVVAAKYPKS